MTSLPIQPAPRHRPRRCFLLILMVAGCNNSPAQLLNDQFDFVLGESAVALTPGGSEVEVSVRVVTGDLVEADDCTWEVRSVPAGVSADPIEEGCRDFAWTLSADETAAVGSAQVELVGTARYFASSGIASSGEVVEEVIRTLSVEVTPSIQVRIISPESGLITTESTVELVAEARDSLNEIEEIAWRNGGPFQVLCTDGCNANPGDPVRPDAVVGLQAGSNLIEVQAVNSLGQVAEDSVTVTYQPVVAGTARWDGEAGDNLWTTGMNWDSNAVPGPGDDVFIELPSAAVIFDVPDGAAIRSLTLGDASLTIGRGELDVEENSTVQGDLILATTPGPGRTPGLSLSSELQVAGSFECSGTSRVEGGTVRIGEGAQARIELCTLAGSEFINGGNATIAGAIGLASDASLENEAGGSLRFENIALVCESTCTGTFVNAGSAVLTGFVSDIVLPIENSGTIEFQSDIVTLSSGTNEGDITSSVANVSVSGDWTSDLGSTLQVSSLFVGPNQSFVASGGWDVGELQIENGATVRLTASATPSPGEEIEVTDGTLILAPNVELESDDVTLFSGRIEVGADGILYARSRMRWSTGVLAGGGSTRVIARSTTDPAPTLLMDGTADRTLDGHRLLVVGETTWTGGDLLAGNGAEFNNFASTAGPGNGLVRLQSDNSFLGEALGGVIAFWLNQGTIFKEIATGETLIDGCYQEALGGQIIENSGTVRVEVRCSP
ncbi:MAG: hypothetical protein AAGF92_07530 [Myxococcota bacterium]